jgi:hypothetical protein
MPRSNSLLNMEVKQPYLCLICRGINATNTRFDWRQESSQKNVYQHHPSLVSLEASALSGCTLCSYLVDRFRDYCKVENFCSILASSRSESEESSVKLTDLENLEAADGERDEELNIDRDDDNHNEQLLRDSCHVQSENGEEGGDKEFSEDEECEDEEESCDDDESADDEPHCTDEDLKSCVPLRYRLVGSISEHNARAITVGHFPHPVTSPPSAIFVSYSSTEAIKYLDFVVAGRSPPQVLRRPISIVMDVYTTSGQLSLCIILNYSRLKVR